MLVALFAAVVALVGFLAMRRIQKTVDAMEEDTLPTLVALADVRSAGHRISAASSELALSSTGTTRTEEMGRELALVREERARYETAISRLEALPQNDDDRRLVGEIRGAGGRLLSLSDEIVATSERGAPPTEFIETVSHLEIAEEGYFRVMDEAIRFEGREAAADSVALRAALERTRLAGAALGVLAVILALLVGLSTSRSILRPLRSLEAAVAGIRSGDLSARAHVATGDELGMLGESFDRMTEELERSVAERKRAGEELRGSEERYHVLFEANPQPLWVEDAESLAVLGVNEAAVTQYGYSREALLSMKSSELRLSTGPAAPERENEAVAHRRKDGTTIYVDIATHDILFAERRARLVLAHDVTHRTLLEEQLRQSQKMEAVGRLAGGVAHDFNNLLTVIQGYADILAADSSLSLREGPAEAVEQIRVASQRSAGLTRQLLAFSRQQVLQPKVLDLNSVVSNLAPMLRRMIGEDVKLVTSLDPKLGRVLADEGQLEQVIMNLIVNSRDAMPQGGTLTVETGGFDVTDLPGVEPEMPAGRYARLTVKDTGTGMSPQVQAKIFEPFFTTKEHGKGTGLGLATVYGIVKQSGGFLHLHSEMGHGSTFNVYLPCTEEELRRVEPASGIRRALPSKKIILLIEDEEAVRKLLVSVLSGQGYTVLEASSGQEALNVASGHSGPIHLVLSDVVMPGGGGPRFVAELKRTRPTAEVIFMSGYTDDSVVRHGLTDVGTHFLQKPFTPATLLKKLLEVLEG